MVSKIMSKIANWIGAALDWLQRLAPLVRRVEEEAEELYAMLEMSQAEVRRLRNRTLNMRAMLKRFEEGEKVDLDEVRELLFIPKKGSRK